VNWESGVLLLADLGNGGAGGEGDDWLGDFGVVDVDVELHGRVSLVEDIGRGEHREEVARGGELGKGTEGSEQVAELHSARKCRGRKEGGGGGRRRRRKINPTVTLSTKTKKQKQVPLPLLLLLLLLPLLPLVGLKSEACKLLVP